MLKRQRQAVATAAEKQRQAMTRQRQSKEQWQQQISKVYEHPTLLFIPFALGMLFASDRRSRQTMLGGADTAVSIARLAIKAAPVATLFFKRLSSARPTRTNRSATSTPAAQ